MEIMFNGSDRSFEFLTKNLDGLVNLARLDLWHRIPTHFLIVDGISSKFKKPQFLLLKPYRKNTVRMYSIEFGCRILKE